MAIVPTRLRAAQLHNDAGLVGAVYYFRQTQEALE